MSRICKPKRDTLGETKSASTLILDCWSMRNFFLLFKPFYYCCSVIKSCPTLWPHGLQHIRLPSPSLSPGVYLNSCPLSRWCYLTISSSATPFLFCLQPFSAPGSFPVSWLFKSGGQSTGASASVSVLSMNIQGWFPPGGFPGSSVGKESTCSAGDPGLIPGLGRSTGEGIGCPL